MLPVAVGDIASARLEIPNLCGLDILELIDYLIPVYSMVILCSRRLFQILSQVFVINQVDIFKAFFVFGWQSFDEFDATI